MDREARPLDFMNARNMVVSFLQSLQEKGQSTLVIDEDARGILRNWMVAARQGKKLTASHPITPPRQEQEPNPSAPAMEMLHAALEETNSHTPEPAQEVFFRLPEGDTASKWAHFERMLSTWGPLRDLNSLRETPVFGEGSRHADIMFVGDAPGYKDELEKRPFVGAAGEKFDGMIKAMCLSRPDIYVTHLVKFRPKLPRQTSNNRPPSDAEIALSATVMEAEIALVQPKVIVALGIIAARGLLKLGNLPLSEYQSGKHFYGSIPLVVTHHPSYLLRSSELSERRALWEEMLEVMKIAHLPISEKQQGYFLAKK